MIQICIYIVGGREGEGRDLCVHIFVKKKHEPRVIQYIREREREFTNDAALNAVCVCLLLVEIVFRLILPDVLRITLLEVLWQYYISITSNGLQTCFLANSSDLSAAYLLWSIHVVLKVNLIR